MAKKKEIRSSVVVDAGIKTDDDYTKFLNRVMYDIAAGFVTPCEATKLMATADKQARAAGLVWGRLKRCQSFGFASVV
jgi:hypothetical protein